MARARKEKDMFGKRMIAVVPAVVLATVLVPGGARTAAAQAEIEALVFWDVLSTNKTARACRDLGYTLTEARSSEAEFIAFLNAQPWDFVGIELPWDLITQKETVAQLLEDHVAAGGRLLVNFNNLDEWPRLQTLLGVADALERLVPENVLPLVPRHPSFAGFGLAAIGNVWSDSGDTLIPTNESTIAGAFANGDGAIIVANGTRSIVNGFDWESYGGSSPFAKFQIQYVMACRADFDQSTGQEVLDVFDFLAFQNAFVTQHPTANMKYDQVFDIFDFLAFQSAFVNGCQ
jgi:hypothetical protein